MCVDIIIGFTIAAFLCNGSRVNVEIIEVLNSVWTLKEILKIDCVYYTVITLVKTT